MATHTKMFSLFLSKALNGTYMCHELNINWHVLYICIILLNLNRESHFKKRDRTLFIPIVVLCGTDNVMQNIPHIQAEYEKYFA